MATITVTPTPADAIAKKKEELRNKYEDLRLRKRGAVFSHDVISDTYGGSDQLLADFIEVYGSWGNAYQEFEGTRPSWNGGYEDLNKLLRWCSNQLGRSPSVEDRQQYRRLGVLPGDDRIQNKYGRKDFTAIYRMAGLPAPGSEYKPSTT